MYACGVCKTTNGEHTPACWWLGCADDIFGNAEKIADMERKNREATGENLMPVVEEEL